MTTSGTSQDLFQVPLILGMMRLSACADLATPAALADWIAARVDEGLTVFDHANIYGNGQCEWQFGKALEHRPSLKQRVRVITKANIVPAGSDVSPWTIKHYNSEGTYLQHSIDTALSRLQLDHLDCFLLHRPDPLMPLDETARALEDAVSAGKVGSIGVSNFLPEQWRLLRNALRVPVLCNQLELSLLASQALFDGTLDAVQRDGLKALAWSPFAGGRISEGGISDALHAASETTGMSPNALAIAWLRRIPGGPIPVIGTFDEQRIQEARKGCDFLMPRPLWFKLLEATRGYPVA